MDVTINILSAGTTHLKDQFKFDAEQAEQAEKALETLESNLIHTLDAHRLGIIIFDRRGDLVSCNRQWERLYELKYEAILDYNILEDTNLQRKRIWQPIKNAFSGTAGFMEENYFSPEEWGKKGRPRWTEGNVLPLFEKSANDNFLGAAIFLQDVTERRMTALEIESLRKLLTEVSSRQEGICRRLADLHEMAQQQSVANLCLRAGEPGRERPPFIPRREREVFEKLAAGFTVKEAAHQLGLGIKSVYTYRSRLLKRLDINGDVGLALAWRELQDRSGDFESLTEMKIHSR